MDNATVERLIKQIEEVSPTVYKQVLDANAMLDTCGIIFGATMLVIGIVCLLFCLRRKTWSGFDPLPPAGILSFIGAALGLLFGIISLVCSLCDIYMVYNAPHYYVIKALTRGH